MIEIQLRHPESSLVSVLYRTENTINGHFFSSDCTQLCPNAKFCLHYTNGNVIMRLHKRITTYWFIFFSQNTLTAFVQERLYVKYNQE